MNSIALGALFAASVAAPQVQTMAPKTASASAGVGALKISGSRTLPGIRPLAFAAAPTGTRIALSQEDNQLVIFDVATRTVVKTLATHPQSAYAVAWSPDGKFVASGDESARIWIFRVSNWTRHKEIRMHQRGIQSLSFSKDGKLLISTGKDDALNVWNVETGKRVGQVLGAGANLYSGTNNPSALSFIVGTLASGSREYRLVGGAPKKVRDFVGHDGRGVLGIAINRAGSRAVSTGRDDTSIFWDLKTGKSMGRLRGHQDWVVHASFAPSGRVVATSSTDRTVNLYETTRLQRLVTLSDQSGIGSPLAFTADGRYLVTIGIEDTLRIHTLSVPQPAPVVAPAKRRR